jgi:hypothetical protein
MARQFQIPAHLKPVQLLNPQTTNGALTSKVITLKNAMKAFVVFEFTQAVAFASVPTLNQATNIAAGTNKAGPAVPIWANEDTAASDVLVKQADASSYTLAANVKNKQVVFEIDPSRLDVNNGYKTIYFTMASSSQATNLVSATAYILNATQQGSPLTAVLD